jgi:hypothetical protein
MTSRRRKGSIIGGGIAAAIAVGLAVMAFTPVNVAQNAGQMEKIKLSNVHDWVAGNNTSTLAFIVENTGSKDVTINSISLRGLDSATSSWYYKIMDSNSQLTLPPDYSEESVDISGSGAEEILTNADGPVTIGVGQKAVFCIDGAGGVTEIDAGNTYAVQVKTENTSAVAQVSVTMYE